MPSMPAGWTHASIVAAPPWSSNALKEGRVRLKQLAWRSPTLSTQDRGPLLGMVLRM
ncbi:hypothetical protein CBOM_05589 [Ceraceosorus bombacis]|uniref:Uncharacterized protein n=1 Tax=Ceraceosorus bombacis TaxID=401625 RepID=A0A0P1BQJ5_9BASI|nr:hypothetical protein CBOM_05589 [Ceraceosorus bombacis]